MLKQEAFDIRRRTKQLFNGIVFIFILVLGWVYPLLGFFIPLCMILGLSIGFVRGRKWCDWFCPRGSFYDFFVKSFSRKKAIPRLFRKISFRITVLLLLMAVMTINLIMRWPDIYRIGSFFVILLTITTALGVILGIIFHQRSWCMLCPIGTMIYLIGRSKEMLKIDSEKCIECKLCEKVCPVQIKPYVFKSKEVQIMRDRDCLKCRSCVAACHKGALDL